MTGGANETSTGNDQWELWEVFVQHSSGQAHEHVGSLRAAGAELAIQNARDVFARRGRTSSIWVVRASEIAASMPEDTGAFFDPANDKIYRHPQFYKLPRGMSSE